MALQCSKSVITEWQWWIMSNNIRCAGTLCRLTDEFCQDPKQFLRLSDERLIDEEKRLISAEERRRTLLHSLASWITFNANTSVSLVTSSFNPKPLSSLLDLDLCVCVSVCVSEDHTLCVISGPSAVPCSAATKGVKYIKSDTSGCFGGGMKTVYQRVTRRVTDNA